ncbi:MAG: glycosyltransferase [Pseudomonadota bacterium]
MARDDNQIIGVCRFSYLGEGGFQAQSDGFERAAERLYAIPRMRRRFAFFENICLPSLAAQTDQNFRLVALIGDTMPFRWRKRLKALMEPYPFLEVCTLEAAGPLNSTRRAFRRGWDQRSRYVTGFRLDDDDAVANDYIERTRAAADQLLDIGWADEDTPAAICFHRGIYWDMTRPEEEQFWDFSEKEPLGLASAMITTPDGIANIYRWNHRRLASQVRCWTDPNDYMFVRTLHGHNDSGRSIPPDARALPAWQAKKLFRDRFGLAPKKLLPRMTELQSSDE